MAGTVETHPVFKISVEQGAQLVSLRWTKFESDYVILPFAHFSLAYDSPVPFPLSEVLDLRNSDNTTTEFSLLEKERADNVTAHMGIARHEVIETDYGFDIIETVVPRIPLPSKYGQTFQRVRVGYRADEQKSRWLSYCDNNGKWVDMEQVVHGVVRGGSSWWNICGEQREVGGISKLIISDDARTARAVIAFLLALNHRAVRAVYGPAPNRQQRRQAEREGTLPEQPIEVYITRTTTGSFARAAADVAEGHHVRQRRAHMVRGHLRHYKSGLTVPVRSHTRGGNEARIPIYDARSVTVSAADGGVEV